MASPSRINACSRPSVRTLPERQFPHDRDHQQRQTKQLQGSLRKQRLHSRRHARAQPRQGSDKQQHRPDLENEEQVVDGVVIRAQFRHPRGMEQHLSQPEHRRVQGVPVRIHCFRPAMSVQQVGKCPCRQPHRRRLRTGHSGWQTTPQAIAEERIPPGCFGETWYSQTIRGIPVRCGVSLTLYRIAQHRPESGLQRAPVRT